MLTKMNEEPKIFPLDKTTTKKSNNKLTSMRIPLLLKKLLSSNQEFPCAKLAEKPIDPLRPSTSSLQPPPLNNVGCEKKKNSYSRTSKIFQQLKKECLKRGQLFVDSEFPPTNESLFLDESGWDGTNLEIEWRRPGEIVDNPKLFVEGASPFDSLQGILGNCWFVSACSALTHSDTLLYRIIPDPAGQEWSEENAYAGIFQFCFWRFGRWVDVIIDDLLPCRGGELLFAHSKTRNEFWSALLEKAFAKLYGCYENLVGGRLADALQDVSGGVAETLNIKKFLERHQQQQKQQQKLLLNGRNCSDSSSDRRRQRFSRLNNIPSQDHPFSNGLLLLLQQQQSQKTNGKSQHYHHQLPAPKRLFYTLKQAFDREALIVAAIAAKKEEVEKSLDCGLVMGHAYALTAIRYIDLDAKWKNETGLPDRGEQPMRKRQAMVRLQNPWGEKEWNGPWSDGSAEWEQVTEEQKCRLGITVDEDGEFWMPWEEFLKYFTDISVCQLFSPTATTMTTTTSISANTVQRKRTAVAQRQRQLDRQKQEGSGQIESTFRRSNLMTIGIPVGRHYHEWSFYGRWTTNGVKSGAPQDRAGGCPNFPATFCFNPQFLLDVRGPGPAEVMFALSQPDQFGGKKRQPHLAAGLHLMRVELNRRHRIHQAIGPVATSEFSSGRSVHLHLSELAPGRFLLVPSSFAPREEGDFLLRIFSTQRLSPRPIDTDAATIFGGIAKCGVRIRCVVRLCILELFYFPSRQQTNEVGGLFCRLATSIGERARTAGVVQRNRFTCSYNFSGDSFIFHSHCPSIKFTIGVCEQRTPLHRRNKCLGRTLDFCVHSEQNGRLLVELELWQRPGKNVGAAAANIFEDKYGVGRNERRRNLVDGGRQVGKVRIEVSAYDDLFYL